MKCRVAFMSVYCYIGETVLYYILETIKQSQLKHFAMFS